MKKKINLFTAFLKILAVIGFFLPFLPLFSILRYSMFEQVEIPFVLLDAFICILAALICCGLGTLMFENVTSKKIKWITVILWFILSSAAVCFIIPGTAAAEKIYPVILWAASSAAGLLFSRKDYNEFVSRPFYLASMLFGIVACAILPDTSILVGSLFLLTIIHWILENQGRMDDLMTRREYSMSRLPVNIRKKNIIWLLVAFLPIFLFFVIRKPVSWLLGQIWSFIKRVLLLWLTRQFPNAELPELPPFEEIYLPSGGEFPWQIVAFVLLAVFFLLLWCFRKKIAAAIRGVFCAFTQWWRSLWRNTKTMIKNEEYIDTEEFFGGDSIGPNRLKRHHEIKQWRKMHERFLRLAPSNEAFRAGYALYLQGIRLAGLLDPASKTPLELAENQQSLLPEELAITVAKAYNLLRYQEADLLDTEPFERLKKLLDILGIKLQKYKNTAK